MLGGRGVFGWWGLEMRGDLEITVETVDRDWVDGGILKQDLHA
jgi:hypothetical protein